MRELLFGSFCEYGRANDVKQKKQKTENNSNPKWNETTMSHKQKKNNALRCLLFPIFRTVKPSIFTGFNENTECRYNT